MNAPEKLPFDQAFEHIGVLPSTVNIGADIEGVDLSKPLSQEVLGDIRRAWLRYKVIFFRNQQISEAQHVSFAKCFSDLERHPVNPTVVGHPDLMLLARGETKKNSENEYHTDMTFRSVPPMGAVLRAVELPPVGGDTIWVNMAAAYNGLPEGIKEKLDGLVAVHDPIPVFAHRLTSEALETMKREYPPIEHPVVATHPETGEKILYVNRVFTTHFVNTYTDKFIRRSEGDALLTLLFNQVMLPEYQVRFRWRKDSIVAWDNRSTQHYAVLDYIQDGAPQARRVMHRATLKGTDRPTA